MAIVRSAAINAVLSVLLLNILSVAAITTTAETTEACNDISEALPDLVLFPRNIIRYKAEKLGYWSLAAQEVNPACIVSPSTAEDVSTVIQILNNHTNVEFAVRSGGHDPNVGHATTEGGVLISMSQMVGTTYDESTGLARVKPGGEWNDVIGALEPYGVTIPGGRLGKGAGKKKKRKKKIPLNFDKRENRFVTDVCFPVMTFSRCGGCSGPSFAGRYLVLVTSTRLCRRCECVASSSSSPPIGDSAPTAVTTEKKDLKKEKKKKLLMHPCPKKSVVQWETVMANGSVVTVDSKRHPDLSAAMRGSGSQFGRFYFPLHTHTYLQTTTRQKKKDKNPAKHHENFLWRRRGTFGFFFC